MATHYIKPVHKKLNSRRQYTYSLDTRPWPQRRCCGHGSYQYSLCLTTYVWITGLSWPKWLTDNSRDYTAIHLSTNPNWRTVRSLICTMLALSKHTTKCIIIKFKELVHICTNYTSAWINQEKICTRMKVVNYSKINQLTPFFSTSHDRHIHTVETQLKASF